jgi:uncharacterized membrane protein
VISAQANWKIWTISLVMMVCSWLSYVDRQTLAVLSPTILRDSGMSAQDYTWVLASFNYAYMIANPLWGSMLDYFGLRVGMLIAVGLWTLASASHAFMGGFLGFSAPLETSARHRHFLQRRITGSDRRAAHHRTDRQSIRMALCIPRYGRNGAGVARLVDLYCTSPIPTVTKA